jgi:hypothetical protein
MNEVLGNAMRDVLILHAVESLGPRRALLVIDQLEQIFTLADRDGRRELFAKLDELRRVPTCHLALIVRADFQGALMQSELWPHVQRSIATRSVRCTATTSARRLPRLLAGLVLTSNRRCSIAC